MRTRVPVRSYGRYRLGLLVGFALTLFIITAPAVLAEGPNVNFHDLFIVTVNAPPPEPPVGSLGVKFREVGVSPTQLILYQLQADATATYVCLQDRRQAPAQQQVVSQLTTQPAQPPNINVMYVAVPPQPASFTCQGTIILAEVSYDNILLCDLTNIDCEQRRGSITKRFIRL